MTKNKKEAAGGKFGSLLIAIVTVLSSFYLQYSANRNQAFLKHYEVELKPKQEGYSNFMKSLSKSYFAANDRNTIQLTQYFDQGESNYYIIEPFLKAKDRDSVWQQYVEFTSFCLSISKSDTLRQNIDNTSSSYLQYRDFFRTKLYHLLFEN